MKIFLITHTAYPDFIGGRERHIHNIASVLSETDEVTVVAAGRNRQARERAINGYRLVTLPELAVKVSGNPLQIYRIMPSLFSVLRKEGPDIIHAFEYGSYSTDTACLYSRKYNTPFVLTIYGYQLLNPLLKILKRLYDYTAGRMLLKQAKRIFCPSVTQKEEVLRIIGPGGVLSKVRVQENSICVGEYTNLTAGNQTLSRFGPDEGVKLLTVVRMLPRKGVKYLISALKKIVDEYRFPKIKLLIIGPDCGELKNIKKYVRKLGLEDKTVIVGPASHEEVKNFLAACDIFILPSLYEGLPLALLEAMACGKPVIFSDIRCAEKVITHGENGLLVKPADADSLAEAIFDLSRDAGKRERLGGNARGSVERFDSRLEAKRTKELYVQLYGAGRR